MPASTPVQHTGLRPDTRPDCHRISAVELSNRALGGHRGTPTRRPSSIFLRRAPHRSRHCRDVSVRIGVPLAGVFKSPQHRGRVAAVVSGVWTKGSNKRVEIRRTALFRIEMQREGDLKCLNRAKPCCMRARPTAVQHPEENCCAERRRPDDRPRANDHGCMWSRLGYCVVRIFADQEQIRRAMKP